MIVTGPSDGIANTIVPPPRLFAALIASRSVQSAALQSPSSWSSLVLTTIGSGERNRIDGSVVAAERGQLSAVSTHETCSFWPLELAA